VIPWDSPIPKVLFTHNVEAAIWRRHYEVATNLIWKAISLREWRKMESAERRYLRLADQVLTVSETDRDAFAAFVDPAKLTVIPTGVDVDYFHPMPTEEAENSLGIHGLDGLTSQRRCDPLLCRRHPSTHQTEVPRRISRGRRPKPRDSPPSSRFHRHFFLDQRHRSPQGLAYPPGLDGESWASFYFDNFFSAFNEKDQGDLLTDGFHDEIVGHSAYRNVLAYWESVAKLVPVARELT